MSVESHIDQLRIKHEGLDEKIRQEEKRPGTDHLNIAELKRRKLQVKEEIERLSSEIH